MDAKQTAILNGLQRDGFIDSWTVEDLNGLEQHFREILDSYFRFTLRIELDEDIPNCARDLIAALKPAIDLAAEAVGWVRINLNDEATLDRISDACEAPEDVLAELGKTPYLNGETRASIRQRAIRATLTEPVPVHPSDMPGR